MIVFITALCLLRYTPASEVDAFSKIEIGMTIAEAKAIVDNPVIITVNEVGLESAASWSGDNVIVLDLKHDKVVAKKLIQSRQSLGEKLWRWLVRH